jgi:ABC-type amino acid transport system permease subunit
VIVLEKNRLGAGASGIACGVVRNFYFSPPMAEVIRVSVELFESDPAGFGFHGVGYIAAVPEVQAEDCVAIQRHQAEIGYRSEVIRGGVLSVRRGQMRAALALGMTRGQAIRTIILPQAAVRMLPPSVPSSFW